MRIFLSTILLTLSCKEPELVFDPPAVIRLDWQEGQTWHVASSKQSIANMTEESPVSLEYYSPNDALSENWSEQVIWTYKVVDDKLEPTDPRLVEFATSAANEVVELTIIKVFVDPTLNFGSNILELNPITYLIFRSDNNRLICAVQFTTINGDITQESYSLKHGNHSSSILSQSQIVLAPTYLAPFGARWYTTHLKTETGNYVYSDWVDNYIVDVTYSDEMGGEMITSRYQRGYPWPTETASVHHRSKLLEEEDLYEIRGNIPPEEPEDLDFRLALSTAPPIDLDEVIRLPELWREHLQDGMDDLEVQVDDTIDDSFPWEVAINDRPWAGNWWSLRKGELVFGHRGSPTFSDQIKDNVDFQKSILDQLSSEIRNLEKQIRTDAVQEQIDIKRGLYTNTQKALADELTYFYDHIKADLDSGTTYIQGNYLMNVRGENYVIDELSPLDKMGLSEYLELSNYANPFYISGWEILNGYNPGGEAWWGHTNGCAAAAILAKEPTESIITSAGGHNIRFHEMDLKGLLTAAHSSTNSYYYGERFRKESDDERDLDPEAFHKVIVHYLKQRRQPFVVDIEKRNSVWNHPVMKVEPIVKFIKQKVVEGSINVTITTVQEMTDYGIPEDYAIDIINYRDRVGIIESRDEFQQLDHYDEAYNMFFRTESRRTTYMVRLKASVSNCQNIELANSGDPEEVNLPGALIVHWRYYLDVNDAGLIIAGEWQNPLGFVREDNLFSELDEEVTHPDFAWLPYHNSRGPAYYSVENPYLNYASFLYFFGEDFKR